MVVQEVRIIPQSFVAWQPRRAYSVRDARQKGLEPCKLGSYFRSQLASAKNGIFLLELCI